MKNEKEILNKEISLLRNKQALELMALREQLYITYESIKPINIIKSTFKEVTESPEIKNGIVNNTIGIAAGYLTKKVFFGASHNPVKRLLGTLFQFAIANIVSKNSDTIKSVGENVFQHILKHDKVNNIPDSLAVKH